MELGNLLFGNSRGNYPVPRGFSSETYEWQHRFYDFLDHIGCDNYGFLLSDQDNKHQNHRGGITTEVFEINPYYWGDDDVECLKSNFIYFPTGYKLMWYKYPLRDAYSNQRLDFEQFDEILKKCEEYYDNIKQL